MNLQGHGRVTNECLFVNLCIYIYTYTYIYIHIHVDSVLYMDTVVDSLITLAS